MKMLFATAALLAVTFAGNASAQSFSENFDAAPVTPWVPPTGWVVSNLSVPIGSVNWFQGNNAVFPAQAGATTAYAGCNFNSVTGANTISDWLITPVTSFTNGDTFSFFTRTVNDPFFPDRLQLLLSTGGLCSPGATPTSVGDFTTVLQDINPTYTGAGYPSAWTQFTSTLSGLPAGTPSTGCFAFRYFVEDGGPAGNNSDYIGVDTVVFTDNDLIFADGFDA